MCVVFLQDCWICKEPLEDDRVRDHDHVTGEFRGEGEGLGF